MPPKLTGLWLCSLDKGSDVNLEHEVSQNDWPVDPVKQASLWEATSCIARSGSGWLGNVKSSRPALLVVSGLWGGAYVHVLA